MLPNSGREPNYSGLNKRHVGLLLILSAVNVVLNTLSVSLTALISAFAELQCGGGGATAISWLSTLFA